MKTKNKRNTKDQKRSLCLLGTTLLAMGMNSPLAFGNPEENAFQAEFVIAAWLSSYEGQTGGSTTEEPVLLLQGRGQGEATGLGAAYCQTLNHVIYGDGYTTATYVFVNASGDSITWRAEGQWFSDPENSDQYITVGAGTFESGTGQFKNASGDSDFCGAFRIVNPQTGEASLELFIEGRVSGVESTAVPSNPVSPEIAKVAATPQDPKSITKGTPGKSPVAALVSTPVKAELPSAALDKTRALSSQTGMITTSVDPSKRPSAVELANKDGVFGALKGSSSTDGMIAAATAGKTKPETVQESAKPANRPVNFGDVMQGIENAVKGTSTSGAGGDNGAPKNPRASQQMDGPISSKDRSNLKPEKNESPSLWSKVKTKIAEKYDNVNAEAVEITVKKGLKHTATVIVLLPTLFVHAVATAINGGGDLEPMHGGNGVFVEGGGNSVDARKDTPIDETPTPEETSSPVNAGEVEARARFERLCRMLQRIADLDPFAKSNVFRPILPDNNGTSSSTPGRDEVLNQAKVAPGTSTRNQGAINPGTGADGGNGWTGNKTAPLTSPVPGVKDPPEAFGGTPGTPFPGKHP